VQLHQVAERVRMRELRRAAEELVIGERGVVAQRLAGGQGRERVQVERVDGIARAPTAERVVRGPKMQRGIGAALAGSDPEGGLAPDALARAADEERDDRQRDEDPDHSLHVQQHVRIGTADLVVEPGGESLEQRSDDRAEVEALGELLIVGERMERRIRGGRIDPAAERRVHQGEIPTQLVGLAIDGIGGQAIGEGSVIDRECRLGELHLGRLPQQCTRLNKDRLALGERRGPGPLDQGEDLVQPRAVRGRGQGVRARDAARRGPQREAKEDCG
jgi:hypothetical protein